MNYGGSGKELEVGEVPLFYDENRFSFLDQTKPSIQINRK